ncbi:G-type lectin S-receptor-like serine/threonine-protein kinase [Dorcoceras hygrometricum]|uniref:G-type lectin S-receptor-like serine/threonine-protein kinase n=1 Tax=Dorcoceras hygrometricum TaxID=472368 RepID=A0A2Z7AFU3_9LAMI|nr:G-type lectin S-receptor-like serine/threonine-protein kinase [Dorcoceras hygrometricum]
MSLFDLQDVCIAIGSLATLALPKVVDLIGIYGLKGPYCTLTTTKSFLQALSVIPRGSWCDVARSFTMIRWASPILRYRSHNGCGPTASCIPEPLRVKQADEGTLLPVVDLTDDLQPPTDKSLFPYDSGWSQAPRCQQARSQNAVVSINPNDIVLLSLTTSINWLHYSSLLIADVTADFIIADPALALLFTTADCDDITADVIIADSRSCASSQLLILDFFQSTILMSSLLLPASSSRHADVIIAESRFLFASIQQLISSFFALLILDLYCSSSSSTYLQQTS